MEIGTITVISGASGVGKDMVIGHLVRDFGYTRVVSYSIRAPRAGEKDGVDYHFVSPEEFLHMKSQGELIDHAVVAGNHYGLGRSTIDRHLSCGDMLVVNAVVATGYLLRASYRSVRLVFLSPPNKEALFLRLKGRGMPQEEIRRRYEEQPLQHVPPADYDLVVTNDDGGAAKAASLIALGERTLCWRRGA